MVYVLVYRRFDYYRFDDVITASIDLVELYSRIGSLNEARVAKNQPGLPAYTEISELYKECYPMLEAQETPHFVIMEFK